MMQTLRDFGKILDWHTGVVVVLAMLATYLSRRFSFIIDLPTNLIGIAVIFPLVFSINSAYKQRQNALVAFAGIKAHTAALYWAHRDWLPKKQMEVEGKQLLQALMTAIANHLSSANEMDYHSGRGQVYQVFSEYSRSHEQMRMAGVPANEISRANQYLKNIAVDFEKMDNILYYRTPVALRAYSRLFLNLFPILFAPFFAQYGLPEHPSIGYWVAICYTLVLVSLDNIQDDLENPFDGVGADDLQVEIAGIYTQTVTGENMLKYTHANTD
jgi:predicted membrane chloride channel (bestrophin family)